jgi:thioesterase domain-containing protein
LRSPLQPPDWYSLVPIQPKGDRPILFGIHLFRFNDLSRYLGPEQPIYGLHYGMGKTIDNDLSMPDKIEDLATHYIKEMRLIQPKGPYYLMGLSLGGAIAYEIAQQLMADGQQIGLLALFDTYIEPREQKRASISQVCFRIWKLGITEFLYRLKLAVMGKIWEIKVAYFQPIDYPQSSFYTRYKPQPYSGKIVLFQAMNPSILYNVDPPELGWRKYAKNLEIHEIPGTHTGILEEPGVQIIAEKLASYIILNDE